MSGDALESLTYDTLIRDTKRVSDLVSVKVKASWAVNCERMQLENPED